MLTMISPVHLLLFGCRQCVWRPDEAGKELGAVLLDDWMPLRMLYSSAARIIALRPALEALLVRVCLRPNLLDELSKDDIALIEVTKELCCQGAYLGKFGQRYRDSIANMRCHRFNADYRRPLLQGRNRRVGPEMDTSTFNQYDVGPSSRFQDRLPPPNYQRGWHRNQPGFNRGGGYRGEGEYIRDPQRQQSQYGYPNQYQRQPQEPFPQQGYSNQYQQQLPPGPHGYQDWPGYNNDGNGPHHLDQKYPRRF